MPGELNGGNAVWQSRIQYFGYYCAAILKPPTARDSTRLQSRVTVGLHTLVLVSWFAFNLAETDIAEYWSHNAYY